MLTPKKPHTKLKFLMYNVQLKSKKLAIEKCNVKFMTIFFKTSYFEN